MNAFPPSPESADEKDTNKLLHELLDGTIAKDEFDRLEQTLLDDPQVRRDYFALMSTDQMLADNYEIPDHLAMHAQLIAGADADAGERRRRNWWIWGSSAAAALVLLSATWFTFFRGPADPARVAGSADSYFLIDGAAVDEGSWGHGQRLEVSDGVVVARLNKFTEACIDGPALVYMGENGRDLDLRRGRVYFRVAPGAPKFKISAAGASIRHIGTEFGVRVMEGGSCEVHVVNGAVEIDRGIQKGKWTLKAGDSASWLNRGNTSLDPVAATDFRKALPGEVVVFQDDFSEPGGTTLKGKQPDVGQPWDVLLERNLTTTGGGLLDTSGSARNLRGRFTQETQPNHRQVVLMSFSTRQPSAILDKQTRMGGIEKIVLQAADGTVICSVQARAKDGHRWRLRDEASSEGGTESELTNISALQENELTLRYDALAGKITLHSGTSTQAKLIAEIPASSRAIPTSVTIWNDDGGDLALKRLSVKVVDYP
ncbi:FecR family protein [Haloferula sp. BvORR071]|uniref:FecR domain-containing protein n=1 Tax=Haloferula sp. BvORR071 TaxID=1396141 RepID=UPI000557AC55|nr:FecR family protein [Haloferula sp. BvORR071]